MHGQFEQDWETPSPGCWKPSHKAVAYGGVEFTPAAGAFLHAPARQTNGQAVARVGAVRVERHGDVLLWMNGVWIPERAQRFSQAFSRGGAGIGDFVQRGCGECGGQQGVRVGAVVQDGAQVSPPRLGGRCFSSPCSAVQPSRRISDRCGGSNGPRMMFQVVKVAHQPVASSATVAQCQKAHRQPRGVGGQAQHIKPGVAAFIHKLAMLHRAIQRADRLAVGVRVVLCSLNRSARLFSMAQGCAAQNTVEASPTCRRWRNPFKEAPNKWLSAVVLRQRQWPRPLGRFRPGGLLCHTIQTRAG